MPPPPPPENGGSPLHMGLTCRISCQPLSPSWLFAAPSASAAFCPVCGGLKTLFDMAAFCPVCGGLTALVGMATFSELSVGVPVPSDGTWAAVFTAVGVEPTVTCSFAVIWGGGGGGLKNVIAYGSYHHRDRMHTYV